jgi:hypothetical protein
MMTTRRPLVIAGAAAMIAARWPALSGAQTVAQSAPFPTRPIRFVMPYAPAIKAALPARMNDDGD